MGCRGEQIKAILRLQNFEKLAWLFKLLVKDKFLDFKYLMGNRKKSSENNFSSFFKFSVTTTNHGKPARADCVWTIIFSNDQSSYFSWIFFSEMRRMRETGLRRLREKRRKRNFLLRLRLRIFLQELRRFGAMHELWWFFLLEKLRYVYVQNVQRERVWWMYYNHVAWNEIFNK